MKRILFTVLIAMLVSAATTVGVLMRYCNIDYRELSVKEDASSYSWTTDGDGYKWTEKQSKKYVDMEKLSNDMKYITTTVEDFNEFLSDQVDKVSEEKEAKQG